MYPKRSFLGGPIGFRFGAGVVKVADKDSLQFFCCERNIFALVDRNIDINNFDSPV
jgi:hypothetical protein